MKKRVLCLLILCLFLISSTAFATNWAFVYKDVETFTYVDTDTVVRNGDTITFWTLEILHTALANGTKKAIRKKEAITSSPRQDKQLESYGYDANDHDLWHYTTPSTFSRVAEGRFEDQLILFALQYAKEGEDSGSIPTP